MVVVALAEPGTPVVSGAVIGGATADAAEKPGRWACVLPAACASRTSAGPPSAQQPKGAARSTEPLTVDFCESGFAASADHANRKSPRAAVYPNSAPAAIQTTI